MWRWRVKRSILPRIELTDEEQGENDRATLVASDVAATNVVLERLEALLREEETDDYGVLRPTGFAFATTRDLLVGAATQIGEPFPRAAVSTDSEGGVRVQWIRPACQVRLVVPATSEGRGYIYHEEGDQYGLVEPVSVAALASWLSWLADHE
jgi:hypothetical protein